MKHIILTVLMIASIGAQQQEDIQSLQEQLKSDPQNVQLLIKVGIAYHDKGSGGDRNAVKKSEEYLNEALELDRSNAVALAYLGSVWTLKGRDAFLPWNKMKYVEMGTDKMDKAIDLVPDNLIIRMIRANNSLNLPSFFHRLQYSLKDFTFITKQSEFQYWPVEQKANVYYHLGLAFKKDKKDGQAQKNFERVLKLASESEWGRKAKEELDHFNSTE